MQVQSLLCQREANHLGPMLVPLKVRQFSDMQRWSMWKADGARPLWRRLLQAAEVRKHCATGLWQHTRQSRHEDISHDSISQQHKPHGQFNQCHATAQHD